MQDQATSQRRELERQLDRLNAQRQGLVTSLNAKGLDESGRLKVQQRLEALDANIERTQEQVGRLDEVQARIQDAVARAQEAVAASKAQRAVAGMTAFPQFGPPQPYIPREAFIISVVFILAVMLPIAVALAKRIARRGTEVVTKLPNELYDRFARLEQHMDAMAIEVERIGEGQRYLTRVLSEKEKVPAIGEGGRNA